MLSCSPSYPEPPSSDACNGGNNAAMLTPSRRTSSTQIALIASR